MSHFVIEIQTANGLPHDVRGDKVSFVTNDGEQHEISEGVMAHRIESKAGDIRVLVLETARFVVAAS